MVHEVLQTGEKLSDDHLAMHLLMALPKSCATIVTIMTHGHTKLNLEAVKSTLLVEWSKKSVFARR
uniref:Uncharacterized protein n=1 Tax=Physcomitrium patens TaxID=3218 RepID=A0A2K1IXG6_PHYPA|nr:hypothetical protein PHYPA_023767 [Physcomitrium patens]